MSQPDTSSFDLSLDAFLTDNPLLSSSDVSPGQPPSNGVNDLFAGATSWDNLGSNFNGGYNLTAGFDFGR